MLTARQLNRATLQRQGLLARASIHVVEAVRRAVALQAQEPASPYVALWNRVAGFDPDDLDRAFADSAVVKAPLMRITLHAVTVDDHPVFHTAMTSALRAARLNDRRFAESGMTVQQVDDLEPGLVEFASTTRAKDEIEAHLTRRLGEPPHERLWWALRTFAPLVHAPTEPPWSFGRRPSFVAAPESGERPSAEEALQRLVVRYLDGFGPATPHDFSRFTLIRVSEARAAFESLRDRLATVAGPDGVELFDVRDAPPPPEESTPAPVRLMAMWDSMLFAYADRSRVIPDAYRSRVIRRNGDTLPTVLVDGHVAGVWRPIDPAAGLGLEVSGFERWSDETWEAVERETADLLTLLAGREPTIYRRYGRWWDDLAVHERRVVG